MELLPIKEIKINQVKIDKIDHLVKSIYRLIIYSRYNLYEDLLDIYQSSIQELQELLSLKNATLLYETVNKIGQEREKTNKKS
jgi:hypothetical protein